ncbi:MAG: CidA/LrgA family protein [Halieaceae bacterium]|nr:CidA/LrgA family protein [Halieaceae bacterium]MCP5204583.1 CidA/LrgA family protein [Pseudomonadales bacterium]
MLGFFILLLSCQLLGEVVVIATGLPLPGPVIGMAVLFVGLLVRGGIPAGLDRMADTLLSHLSLLFVPAGVGVMLHAELLGAQLLPIAGSVVLATMLTIVVTAWIMQLLASGRRPR